ncbi:hypothetical protein CSOJ01_14979 [Colletotrichum sojae]|uniref:Uncharacterized protein n=1 Tax=Colletotrichum sojae TaxID=2175907 RepID=A0A8H6IP25_9PEZI|nr:hypothetical protein CSOJ01_14979 [Colletotrichum sojae]
MPRDGTGRSDNAIEPGHNIVHGAGDAKSAPVDRGHKAADPPEKVEGNAIPGMPASGGSSQGLARGPDVGQGGRRN